MSLLHQSKFASNVTVRCSRPVLVVLAAMVLAGCGGSAQQGIREVDPNAHVQAAEEDAAVYAAESKNR